MSELMVVGYRPKSAHDLPEMREMFAQFALIEL
jgi:hypothetical protein